MQYTTQTGTVTLSPSEGVTIRFQGNLRSTLNKACADLTEITIKFLEEKDGLSERIHAWNYKTLNINFDEKSDEDAAAILGRKTIKLVQKILSNPITNTPFKDPVWVNDWVLERSMLCHLVEIDGHQIGDPKAYPSHMFAKEMVNWVRSLVTSALVPDPAISQEDPMEMVIFNRNNALMGRLRSVKSAEILQVFYRQMSAKAVELRRVRRMTEMAEREIVRCQELTLASQASISREVAAAARAFAEHEEKIRQNISSLETKQEMRVNALQEQMEDQNRRHSEINQTNQQTLNLVEMRLNEAINRSAALARDLSGARQTTQNQDADIQRLRVIIAQQASQIRGFKKHKSRGCTIQ